MISQRAGPTTRAHIQNYSPPPSSNGLVWLSILAFAAFAGLAGLSIGAVGTPGVVAVIGMVAVLAVLWVPVSVTIWILLAVSFLAIGQAEYFLGFRKAYWISYATGGMLYLRLLVELLGVQDRSSQPRTGPLPLFVWFLLLVLFIGIISSTLAAIPLAQAIASGKDYFFLWSVLLAFGVGSVSPQLTSQAFNWLPALAMLQVPVVVYQKLVVEPSRTGGSPFDAVVGLFGGDPHGGGASGAMAFVAVCTILIMVSRWKHKAVSKALAITAIACSLLAVALANVKFALILLPLGMFLLLGRGFLRTPLRAALLALCTVAAVAGIAKVYAVSYTKSGQVAEYFADSLGNNLDTEVKDSRLQISRTAAIKIWAKEVDRSNVYRVLLGYGIGESERGTLFEGGVAKNFVFDIGRSSLVVLLWDVGILGASLFMAAIIAGAINCRAASRHIADGKLSADLSAGWVILLLMLISLPYGTELVNIPQIQLLCILILGQALFAPRKEELDERR